MRYACNLAHQSLSTKAAFKRFVTKGEYFLIGVKNAKKSFNGVGVGD
jgi:hypothetical protein